jgi:mono/diheme cytochrome c family protein
MKKILVYLFTPLLFCGTCNLQAQNTGEETFKSVCAACHTIKMGRKVGPDLSGIYLIRNNEWLTQFIRSSQKFIKSGDTAAIAIYEEYNKIPMPDNQLSNEQILGVIEYIKTTDKNASAALAQPGANDSLTSVAKQSGATGDSLNILYPPEKVSDGISLFYGYARFTNGAPPCISCHNIKDESVMGGGKLALDLTGAYVKLGPVGIKAILTNPPFPGMKTALLKHDLTQNEIQSVISLLKSLGERKYTYSIPGSAGLFFFAMGFVCALVLLVHLYIFYDNRKIP